MIAENKGDAAAGVEEKPELSADAPHADMRDGGDESTSSDEVAELAEELGMGDLIQLKPDTDGDEKPEESEAEAEGDEKPEEAAEEAEGDEKPEEADPEAEGDEKPEDTLLDGISDARKARIQKRIDKLTAARRTAEEQVEPLKARVLELETQIKTGPARIVPADVDPIMLAESEAEIAAEDEKLAKFERMLLKHWDGYEAPDEGGESFTAEQVRDRYHEVKERRERLLPQARQRLQQRRQVDATLVKQFYPDLLDAKSEAASKRERILQSIPGLRGHPFVNLIVGNYLAGEKLVRESIAAKKRDGKTPTKAAPRVPVDSAPARTTAKPTTGKKGATYANRIEKAATAGKSLDALGDALDGLETTDE